MSNEHNFKVGDVVQHKATQQRMVVEYVDGENIKCSFGTKNTYQSRTFKATSLTSLPPLPSGQKVPESW